MIIRLVDKNIRHIPNFNGYDVSKNILWYKGDDPLDITVYSDKCIRQAMGNDHGIKIAWIMEPSVISPVGYHETISLQDQFNYIISHDLNFLAQFPLEKQIFCPASGSSLYSHEWKIYPKSKLILTVIGDKRWTEGHKFRYDIANRFKEKIDIVGRGFLPFPPEKRADTYAPYMYQVAVHNNTFCDYWSDILVDCFATGTVPVVWKGDYLRKYFDPGGFICFDTIDQLEKLLDELSEKDYESRLEAVKCNFKLAFKKYRIVEDYLYDNFFKRFE